MTNAIVLQRIKNSRHVECEQHEQGEYNNSQYKPKITDSISNEPVANRLNRIKFKETSEF